MKEFSTAEWIGLIVSILTMGVGVTAFSYSEFVIKDVYKEDKTEILRRLERIENKLDEIREKRR
jgi:hypothetical protein